MLLRHTGGFAGPTLRVVRLLALASALACAMAFAVPACAAETLVGTGFESGSDGLALSAPWTLSGMPQRAEFDDARSSSGTLSGWLQGPAAAAYAGFGETASAGMAAPGAEQRFWLYCDTANQYRVIDDWSPTTADRALSIQLDVNGAINVYTNRTGNPGGYLTNGYTQVGAYAAGWTQYRVVYDFGTQTYQLSKRASAGEGWTRLKAIGATGYAIPFRGTNAITQSHGLLWRGYNGANMWIDDVAFDPAGISDTDVTAPSAPASLVAVDRPGDGGGAVALSWTAATDDVGVVGYKVYRGTVAGSYGTPITVFSATSYVDVAADNGTRYYYAVSAIDAAGNEGPKSPECSAIARDNLPPDAPTGVLAVGGDRQASVSWTASDASDLAGYNVYRDGAKANASLLTSASFTDIGLVDGTAYAYTVTAVDASGNESAASVSASATTAGSAPVLVGATLVDGGFESGAEGSALGSAWAPSGAPQRAEYDNARAHAGAQSGWIQGPASATYAGFGEKSSAGLTANGAEQRFWVYCDTNSQFRVIDDWSTFTADRAFTIQLDSLGAINVYTNRTGNPNGYATAAYTQVGTYAAGWTEFRVVYDFASQSYQLSKRSVSTDAWTPLKASAASGYAIPFRGANPITQSHGLLWRAYNGANMWVDDVCFSAGAIAEHVVATSAGVGGTVAPTTQVVYGGCDSEPIAITPAVGYEVAEVTVDGAPIGAVSSYRFTRVDGAHTLSATFKPRATSGEMSTDGVDCDGCHAEPATGHGFGVACGECHDLAVKHPGTPTQMHVAADVSNCACHNASLTYEHNGRTTAAGELITCVTCHRSANAAVAAAIAAKDSSCTSCHDASSGHQASHTFTSAADLNSAGDAGCTNSGSGCHGADPAYASFTTYHPNTGCLKGGCHTSASKATYAGDRSCQSCHDGAFVGAPNRSPLASGHYSETTHTAAGMTASVSSGGSASATCATCHPTVGGLAAQHTGVGPAEGSTYGTTVACGECHNDTRANGNAVVKANWTARTCAACHAASSSAPMHSATAPVVTATSGAGCGASGAGCHSTYDVHAIHRNAVGGCTLAGCHDSSKQAAKPTLKACGEAGGCHTTEGTDYHRNASHAVTVAPECSACHTISTLTTTHVTELALTCDTCHGSADAKVIAAIKARDVACDACHDLTGHPASQQHFNSFVGTQSYRAQWYWPTLTAASAGRCVNCHDGTFTATRKSGNELCFTCHDAAGFDLAGYGYQGKAAYLATAHYGDPVVEVGHDTVADFNDGAYASVVPTAGPPANISLLTGQNVARGKASTSTPDSGWGFPIAGAFTNGDRANIAGAWLWGYNVPSNTQNLLSVPITIDLGATTDVSGARLYSGPVAPGEAAHRIDVYLSTNGTTWTLAGSGGTLGTYSGNLYASFGSLKQARYVRFNVQKRVVLATRDTQWLSVAEGEVYGDVASGSWTSPALDISSSKTVTTSTVTWSGSKPAGSAIGVDTDVSLDGGTTWVGWQTAAVSSSGTGVAIPQLTAGTNLGNARLKYRVRLTRSTTSGLSPSVTSVAARVGHAPTNAATVYAGSGASAGACANCHDPHGTKGSGNIRAAGNELCFGCHDVAGITRDATYRYKGRGGFGTSAHSAQQCVGCHAPHGKSGVTSVGMLASPGGDVCVSCHAMTYTPLGSPSEVSRFAASSDPTAHHSVSAAEQDAGRTKIACADCHQPHSVSASSPISDPRTGEAFTAKYWAPQDKLVLRPTQDTYISSQAQTTGFADQPSVEVSTTSNGFEVRGLMSYDLSGLSGRRIKKATLRIERFASTDTGQIVINPITKAWSEFTPPGATMTCEASWKWSGLPAWDGTIATRDLNAWQNLGGDYNAGVAATLTIDPANMVQTLDVTDMLKWMQDNPSYGLIFRPGTRPTWLITRTHTAEVGADGSPTLIVEFEDTTQRTDDVAFCLTCHGETAPSGVQMGSVRSLSSFTSLDHHGFVAGDGGSSNSGGYDAGAGLREPYYYKYEALSCQACHDPHGSTNAYHLLDSNQFGVIPDIDTQGVNASYLCGGCHVLPGHAVNPDGYGATWKNCFSCHHHGTGGYF